MPFSQDIAEETRHAPGPGFPPTRRSRNDVMGKHGRPAQAPDPDGSTEDGRTGAATGIAARDSEQAVGWPPEPPVLEHGAVAVVYDGDRPGRAALDHAIAAASGPLLIVCFWTPTDPVVAARAVGAPGAGAQLLQSVHEANERALTEAQRIAGDAAALAGEAGREAVPLVWREEGVTSRETWLRTIVARHHVAQLVIPASPPSRWRRALYGRGVAERLAIDPPCPCTIVPVDA